MATKTSKKSTKKKLSPSFDFSFPKLPEVPETVSREIFIVSCFSVAILIFLALFGMLGIVGETLEGYFSMFFGFGRYLIPLIFVGLAISKIVSAKIEFGSAKNLGLLLMLLSALGLLHLPTPLLNGDAEIFAASGKFGGYVGHFSSVIFRLSLGDAGALVILSAIFIISLLLTFEVSLSSLFGKNKDLETEEEQETLFDNIPPKRRSHVQEKVTRTRSDQDLSVKAPELKIRRLSDIKSNKGFHIKTPSFDKQSHWEPPALDLLEASDEAAAINDDILTTSADHIREKLQHFGIAVEMREAHIGPTVIQYTLKPAPNVKLQNIVTLAKDLKLALSAKSIRIEAPIPGQSLVGIEVPNHMRSIIRLREVLGSSTFEKVKSNLRMIIGRDVSGKVVIGDLKKMPHLLIAGQTGSGKSVFINSILISLLYQNSPNDLKLILVDPKRVELMPYNHIPHLLTPVITEVEKTASALKWLLAEMSRRYKLFQSKKVKNLDEFNGSYPEERIPNLVLVIDELSDLMMMAGKEVEPLICRLAQMARATGIHLILATQRPSVNVITGLIKANIPSRISFTVASGTDSRTIIDGVGAETLLDSGDMLYLPSGASSPTRIQGVFIDNPEINKVISSIKLSDDSIPDYQELEIRQKIEIPGITNSNGESTVAQSIDVSDDEEPRLQEVIDVIRQTGRASASLLQRRLQFGYARAARALDILEQKNLIGPVEGAKPRKILFAIEDKETGISIETNSSDSTTIVTE